MRPSECAGRKKTKLADLPPAARLALVTLQGDGRIKIHLRYVVPPQEQQAFFIGKEGELFGVPYRKWCEHLGKIIRLWEYTGDGPGMIGGPVKREVGCIWWGGAAESRYLYSAEECHATADRLEAWLDDDRYEFSEQNRKQIKTKIARLREPQVGDALDRWSQCLLADLADIRAERKETGEVDGREWY